MLQKKIQYLTLLLTIFFVSCNTFDSSQDGSIEPLIQQTDSQYIHSMLDHAKTFNDTSTDSIVYYAEKAIEHSANISYKEGIALGHAQLGGVEYGKGNYQKSIDHYSKANKYTNNDRVKGISALNTGLSLIFLDRTEEAKLYLDRSLEILKELDDKHLLSIAYINYGLIEYRNDNHLKAFPYYQEALKLTKTTNNPQSKSLILNNIGLINLKLQLNILALDHFQQAYETIKETNLSNLKAMYLNNMSEVLIREGRSFEALVHIEEGLKITNQSGNDDIASDLLTNKGLAYIELNQYDTAVKNFNDALTLYNKTGDESTEFIYHGLGNVYFKTGQYQKALKTLKIAITKAKERNNKEMIRTSSEMLAEIYFSLNQTKLAYSFMKLSNEMADSLSQAIKIKQFVQMELQFQFDKKQHEFELSQQEINLKKDSRIEKQQLITILIISGFLFIIILILILYRSHLRKKHLQQLKENFKSIQDQNQVIEIKNKALQSLIKTKDKVFSIVAHDITNPFNVILGFADLLSNNYDEIDEAKRKHFIGEIDRASKQTFKLLENLLSWARSQNGNMKIKQEEVSLSELVTGSIKPYLAIAKEKEINVLNNVPEVVLSIDKSTITSVMGNLLGNAIKFTPDGGKITIEGKVLRRSVEVSVSDTGVGIAPDVTKKLFQVGDNISTKGTRDEPGTGLGLIICKDFISKNGGDIRVKSKLGKGSTFTITLPYNQVHHTSS